MLGTGSSPAELAGSVGAGAEREHADELDGAGPRPRAQKTPGLRTHPSPATPGMNCGRIPSGTTTSTLPSCSPCRAMIEAHGLVKRYGSTVAVSDLSFSIRPGLATGFPWPERRREDRHHHADDPGPLLPDAGLGNRRRGVQLPRPRLFQHTRGAGALLDEAKALHGGRCAFDHSAAAWPRATAFPAAGWTRVIRLRRPRGRRQAPG